MMETVADNPVSEIDTPLDHEAGEGLRFDDPYWDDAFCAWWDPALRTCCS